MKVSLTVTNLSLRDRLMQVHHHLIKTMLHQPHHRGLMADNAGSLTTGEAWTMPFTSQWQDLLRKIDSFSTAWAAVWIIMIGVCYSRTSSTTIATGNLHAVCLCPAMTLLAAQCVICQQMSCWVLQHFTTHTCVTSTCQLHNYNCYAHTLLQFTLLTSFVDCGVARYRYGIVVFNIPFDTWAISEISFPASDFLVQENESS